MNHVPSSYYPPRAGWASRIRHAGTRCLRALGLKTAPASQGPTFSEFIVSALVPGYAFASARRGWLGWAVGGVFLGAALLSMAAIGHRISAFAFGWMLSLHAASLVHCLTRWPALRTLGVRLLLTLLCLISLYGAVYEPLADWFTARVAIPLQVRGTVVVFQPGQEAGQIVPGEKISYRLGGRRGENFLFVDGMGYDSVLAMPGDHIEFQPDVYLVNGRPRPALPHMPQEGSLVVPENHWFIWPSLRIVNGRNQYRVNVTPIMLQAAKVPHGNLIGRPYRHWFGRRQTPP
jgi:hypothetical protein